jgi:hypothetical protein
MRVEMELRNLKLFRLMEYLVEAGGETVSERSVQGQGWRAEIVPQPPVQLKLMTIPCDILVIEGEDEAAVDQAVRFMRFKTMRGGG